MVSDEHRPDGRLEREAEQTETTLHERAGSLLHDDGAQRCPTAQTDAYHAEVSPGICDGRVGACDGTQQ